jgi:CDP-glucose 4,6-dehydratase
MLSNIYKNRKVLITGNTGFKGSWLTLWLSKLGATVLGCALEPPSHPSHHDLLQLENRSITCDIRNLNNLKSIFKDFKPEIVFHLAAQALVRESYQNPIYTFETNILGTANIFEACRSAESVKAIVNITSDKCYENKEWVWGYRENDPMGGHDPYSASKGCAELVCASYRDSFFPIDTYLETHQTLVVSCRAGNVIGGGDWGKERLVPDLMKAASTKQKTMIRNPYSTRPWQHVLEPLSGYLFLGEKLLAGEKDFSGPWNFGPQDEGHLDVLTVIKALEKNWPSIKYEISQTTDNPHEANLLNLDCSKANNLLGWRSTWDSSRAFKQTALWYRNYYENNEISSITQLDSYIKDGQNQKQAWAIT